MLLKNPKSEERIHLKGAVQIGHSSFFVFKKGCKTFIKTGKDEKDCYLFDDTFAGGRIGMQ